MPFLSISSVCLCLWQLTGSLVIFHSLCTLGLLSLTSGLVLSEEVNSSKNGLLVHFNFVTIRIQMPRSDCEVRLLEIESPLRVIDMCLLTIELFSLSRLFDSRSSASSCLFSYFFNCSLFYPPSGTLISQQVINVCSKKGWRTACNYLSFFLRQHLHLRTWVGREERQTSSSCFLYISLKGSLLRNIPLAYF